MAQRIDIGLKPHIADARGKAAQAAMASHLGVKVDSVRTRDWMTFDVAMNGEEIERVRAEFTDPVIQVSALGRLETDPFDWMIAVGFKPGVTDNVGRTARSVLGDILGRKPAPGEAVHTATAYILRGGGLDREDATRIACDLLANTVIESIEVVDWSEWQAGKPEVSVPKVTDMVKPVIRRIDLSGSDEDLEKISRGGTLSLSLAEMRAVRDYFAAEGKTEERKAAGLDARPTDLELETIAQTWSEHCKHKIFSGVIEYEDEKGNEHEIRSLFKTFIKGTTAEVAKRVDWLVSVFDDNAGVVRFNDHLDLVFKVETHNSPSALEPYGGAMTGIVGCNRDPMGTGMGAELLINVWGYCFADPFDKREYPEGVLHPRRIRDGVHRGVIDGGNQSGIPYGVGWEFFDPRYASKPMVYCGTLGFLPRELHGKPAAEKEALPGDLIVMPGGRIGKDGIHGATFSSEELHEGSPSQAVQIGDPITQKKMNDFLLEARDLGLYRAITDNGAGGLSSSVGEMAQGPGGAVVDLAKAPLKYAGLMPWEIWLSEAQERMTLAVPPEKWDELRALAGKRDVEITSLGEFASDGYVTLMYGDQTAGRISMDFMHEACPTMKMRAEWAPVEWPEPGVPRSGDLSPALAKMMTRLNIANKSYKWRQYDHEVKGRSIVKPLLGVERDVPSTATVFIAEHGGREGVVLSRGFNSHFSDVDTYAMTASIIDEAVRRIVAVGGRPDWIAGMDNFCWPDPVQSFSTPDGPYKLAQLVRSNQALYDTCVAFNVPLISGKDSMKNDSSRGGKKVSIPPSLLFSALGRIDDIGRAQDLVPKAAGDKVYVIGKTLAELGGSEFAWMLSDEAGEEKLGNRAPGVDVETAKKIYKAMAGAISNDVVRSVHTPTLGGLAVALAEMAFAGGCGLKLDLAALPVEGSLCDAEALFSESNSRFVVTVAPEKAEELEKRFTGLAIGCIGEVADGGRIEIAGLAGEAAVNTSVKTLKEGWLQVFEGV